MPLPLLLLLLPLPPLIFTLRVAAFARDAVLRRLPRIA